MSSSTHASARLRLRLLSAASLALLFSPALAQSATPLPPVAIESAPQGARAPDAPLTTSTLSTAEIRARRAGVSDTPELLGGVAGFAAYGAGGFSSLPSIRGLEAQRVTIVVDGVPIDFGCPNQMNPPLSYTDPQTIQAISVITGVAPVSLGGDSIGGAVSVETREPRFAPTGEMLRSGEVSAFYRGDGHGVGAAVGASVASDRFSLTYAGSYVRSANYSGGGSDGVVRSTEYEKTDHTLSLAARTDAGLFELRGGLQWSPYEGFPNQYMDMTLNRSWHAEGRYRAEFAWGDVDLRGYYRDVQHEMNFLADKGGTAGGGMPMNTNTRSAGYALKVELPLSARDTVRLGSEFHHERLNDYWPPVAGSMMMGPRTYVNLNAARRDRTGAYAEWQAAWSGRWSTVLGVRGDLVRMNAGDVQSYATGMMSMADAMAAGAFNAVGHARSDSALGASALARYAPSRDVTFEIGYAHKTRAPNLYERYAWGLGSMSSRMIGWFGDGNGYVGNLDLKPETADTISAAAEFGGEGAHAWSLRVSPYYTRVHDYIDATRIAGFTTMTGAPTGFVQLKFVNQEAELYGFDLSGSVDLWDSVGAGRARLTGQASWIRGENLDDGGPLYHQMPPNAKLALEHEMGAWRSAAELVLVGEKSRVDRTRNEPRTPAYALVNLRTGYGWGKARLDLEVQNLLDTAYDLPLGGVSLGDYRATGVVRPTPGRGRSVNLGLSVGF